MKKLLSLILTLTLLGCLCLAACGETTPPEGERPPIRIGVMSGPTGMGMAKLMKDTPKAADNSAPYIFEVYTDPQQALADLAAKDLDAVCIPTNTAAAQANKTADYVSVLAINTLGSLYLLSDGDTAVSSLEDLEGKTVHVSVPGSTTKPIVEYLLAEAGVTATVEVEVDHPTLVSRMADTADDHVDILVLPEPYVSKALGQYPAYSVDLNLSTVWSDLSDNDLAMGCLVVRNEFLKENDEEIQLLLKDYKASIEYIANPDNRESAAEIIVEAGILGAKPLATNALTNLQGSIVYRDGAEMKATLVSFYDAIGLKQPTDAFYYAGIKD